MGIKQKNSQTLSRVAIQCSDIENGSSIGDDEIDTQEETDGLKKTSSVLSGTHCFLWLAKETGI